MFFRLEEQHASSFLIVVVVVVVVLVWLSTQFEPPISRVWDELSTLFSH